MRQRSSNVWSEADAQRIVARPRHRVGGDGRGGGGEEQMGGGAK